MGGACSTYGGEKRCVYDFGGETRGKRPIGRPRPRWENNIKKDHQGVAWTDMDWIYLAQDRQVGGSCECRNEPPGFIKIEEFID